MVRCWSTCCARCWTCAPRPERDRCVSGHLVIRSRRPRPPTRCPRSPNQREPAERYRLPGDGGQNMKWLTFDEGGTIRHGYLDGDEIVVTGDGDLAAVVRGESVAGATERRPVQGVRILAPLLTPGKVIAVAANYQEHVKESGSEARDQKTATPRLFLKPED